MPNILPSWQRILLVALCLVAGVFPTVLFFAWIERNCAFPWPWILLNTSSLAWICLCDVFLLCAWVLFLSQGINKFFFQTIAPLVPKQAVRALAVSLTGASLWSFMSLWQNTGIVVWSIPMGSLWTSNGVAFVLYWGLLLIALKTLLRHFVWVELIGLKQIYSKRSQWIAEKKPSVAPHTQKRLYALVLLAGFITPVMSLDRMMLCLAFVAGLALKARL